MKKLFLFYFVFVSHSLFAQEYYELPIDTINFEEPGQGVIEIQIDTLDSTNIWQIAVPNKLFLDSAYSFSHAIITDSLNYYPTNNESFFYLNFSNDYNFTDGVFEIRHKFDTDTLKDGGLIEMSCDSGATWMNIINEDHCPFGYSLEGCNLTDWVNQLYQTPSTLYTNTDSLFNGDYGFSGNSGGWVTTWFGTVEYGLKSHSDNIMLRFKFVSDTINTNKEGWMIDDIRFYQISVPGSIDEQIAPKFKIYPNPVSSSANIELEKIYNTTEVLVYNALGNLVKTHTYSNQRTVTFEKENLPSGVYWLQLKGDSESLGVRRILVE